VADEKIGKNLFTFWECSTYLSKNIGFYIVNSYFIRVHQVLIKNGLERRKKLQLSLRPMGHVTHDIFTHNKKRKRQLKKIFFLQNIVVPF